MTALPFLLLLLMKKKIFVWLKMNPIKIVRIGTKPEEPREHCPANTARIKDDKKRRRDQQKVVYCHSPVFTLGFWAPIFNSPRFCPPIIKSVVPTSLWNPFPAALLLREQKLFSSRIKDGYLTSPVFQFVPDSTFVTLQFNGVEYGLVVEKGSIAVDGISLTIGKAERNSVIVYVIPHTLKVTTLSFKRTGDEVNIEFDILGKYAAERFEKKRFL